MTAPPKPTPPSESNDPHLQSTLDAYWRRNLHIMGILLFLWALLGLGCGILFADFLNQFQLFGTGFKLGFWFAQQGSIIGFVLIVLLYAILMNRADRKHHEDRKTAANAQPGMGGDAI